MYFRKWELEKLKEWEDFPDKQINFLRKRGNPVKGVIELSKEGCFPINKIFDSWKNLEGIEDLLKEEVLFLRVNKEADPIIYKCVRADRMELLLLATPKDWVREVPSGGRYINAFELSLMEYPSGGRTPQWTQKENGIILKDLKKVLKRKDILSLNTETLNLLKEAVKEGE